MEDKSWRNNNSLNKYRESDANSIKRKINDPNFTGTIIETENYELIKYDIDDYQSNKKLGKRFGFNINMASKFWGIGTIKIFTDYDTGLVSDLIIFLKESSSRQPASLSKKIEVLEDLLKSAKEIAGYFDIKVRNE